MKKSKGEILLFVAIIFFVVAGIFFYHESKTLIVATEIPFQEIGTTSYKVYLTDNTYYDQEYLDEGMQYISSIIDYVDVDFKYNANYEGIKAYSVDKNVIADIKITDTDDKDKVIYSKTETIKKEHLDANDLNIDENIKIDYKKYNNLVNDIKTKYGISANCVLTVTYNIIYASQKDGLSTAKKLSIEIPLSKQMINIKKGENINISDIYTAQSSQSILNGIMTLCMVLMIILAILATLSLIKKVKKRISEESKYDRFIAKILKEYDSYITETVEDTQLTNKEVIKINSFKELLDVRNNIDKTIVYTKVDEDTSKFQIIDEEIYEYVVTRKEMDK